MSTTAQKSPAFFIRAVQKADAARVAKDATPAVVPSTPRLADRTILGIVPAPTRRGGVRVTRVCELDRFDGLSGSLVMETRPAGLVQNTQHYLAWHRMATTPRACAVKLRALLRAGVVAQTLTRAAA